MPGPAGHDLRDIFRVDRPFRAAAAALPQLALAFQLFPHTLLQIPVPRRFLKLFIFNGRLFFDARLLDLLLKLLELRRRHQRLQTHF